MLDHANIDAMADMGRLALQIGQTDRCLLILPLFHVNGMVVSVLIPLLAGASRDYAKGGTATLESIGAAYVTVDAPRSDTAKNLVPTVPAVTNGTAYVRFHGRNLGTWNKRGGSAAERFDYLYSENELKEWVPTLRELAGEARQAFALFNNNSTAQDPRNPLATVSQAATNAFELRSLLA